MNAQIEKPPETTAPPSPGKNRQPVVVYIMILFIAAFLLMALSFFMHQRSNAETLGEIRNDLSALQDIQALQDKLIQAQEELADAQEALDAGEIEEASQQAALNAITNLYLLEQAYQAEDYETCRFIISFMEERNQPELLVIPGAAEGHFPEGVVNPNSLTPPRLRFDSLKEAVTAASQTETNP